ncbi:unnamed protein product, partial [Prorocentrum cordatum]
RSSALRLSSADARPGARLHGGGRREEGGGGGAGPDPRWGPREGPPARRELHGGWRAGAAGPHREAAGGAAPDATASSTSASVGGVAPCRPPRRTRGSRSPCWPPAPRPGAPCRGSRPRAQAAHGQEGPSVGGLYAPRP